MQRLALLFLLVITLLPAAKSAASCSGGIWDDDEGLAVALPPSGFDEALVREAVGGASGDICGWAVKPWGRDGRLFVAVLEQPDTLSVAVFEKTDSIRLRARGQMRFPGHQRLNFDRFDFAPYRINPDEIAIGIRTRKSLTYAGGGGRCEGVSLFRLREDRLDLVLYAQIDYSAIVRGEPLADDIPYSVYDVAAAGTLAVSEQQTQGFFDYVRTVKVSSPFDERKRWKSRYTWNGERYEAPGGAEPLEVNCLVAGFDVSMEGPDRERFPDWASQPLAGATSAANEAAPNEAAAAAPVQATAPAGETKWSTRIGSLDVGVKEEKATFSNLRSTCGAFGLTMSLTVAAPDVRKCLGESDTRHVAIELDAGRLVSSSVTPNDRQGQCVLAALGGGHLQSLSCALEADVSR